MTLNLECARCGVIGVFGMIYFHEFPDGGKAGWDGERWTMRVDPATNEVVCEDEEACEARRGA